MQESTSLLLPPPPVLTHWGMWLDAEMCNCENYCTIEKIISKLDSNKTSSIKFLKELFSYLSGNLASVTSNFVAISTKELPVWRQLRVETNDESTGSCRER